MIIDCHTHLGRNDHIKANVGELLHSMDEAGIDKSLVFAGELNDYPTYEMLKEIAPHRDRLHGVASWDFDHFRFMTSTGMYGLQHQYKNQEDVLAGLYSEGQIVAVKFYTGYYHYMPESIQIRTALEKLNKVGCPAIFHCGDCLNSVKCAKLKYSHPLNIDEVAVDYPNMNFIIAHMGYPWVIDSAEVCYKNANVYSDISGFVYGDFKYDDRYNFEKAIYDFTRIAGYEKLLFGSDWPISSQKSYVSQLKETASRNADAYQSKRLTPEGMSEITKKAFKL